jgi:hypothetical protein
VQKLLSAVSLPLVQLRDVLGAARRGEGFKSEFRPAHDTRGGGNGDGNGSTIASSSRAGSSSIISASSRAECSISAFSSTSIGLMLAGQLLSRSEVPIRAQDALQVTRSFASYKDLALLHAFDVVNTCLTRFGAQFASEVTRASVQVNQEHHEHQHQHQHQHTAFLTPELAALLDEGAVLISRATECLRSFLQQQPVLERHGEDRRADAIGARFGFEPFPVSLEHGKRQNLSQSQSHRRNQWQGQQSGSAAMARNDKDSCGTDDTTLHTHAHTHALEPRDRDTLVWDLAGVGSSVAALVSQAVAVAATPPESNCNLNNSKTNSNKISPNTSSNSSSSRSRHNGSSGSTTSAGGSASSGQSTVPEAQERQTAALREALVLGDSRHCSSLS